VAANGMIRTISGAVGLIAISVTIYLESHGHPLAGQCFMWSVLAFAAPVGVAVITGGEFLQAWFLVSLLTTTALHSLLLWSAWERMPFANASVAIVFGFIEAVILSFLCAQIKEWMSTNRSERSRPGRR
jgi:hypothetical protein